ncbi:multidrug resistance efflux pump [Aurantimonas endophytica]|uniref:Multidrug resistance efflux pump n=2 Tax=Aurantimonas endophytica TaxID=1522175 RepID=A0A7W6MNR1_9HYPH|nr:multidrug resistance efflux pump [Aurantimonas endophytica]
MTTDGMNAETVRESNDRPQPRSGNPLRPIAIGVVLLAAVFVIVGIFMERRTPSSSQATVQAYVVGIAPEVGGRVIEVGAVDNSRVMPGQMLFRIDPRQYELAVGEAEARLAQVGQGIGASTASVDVAQARVVEARAARDNAEEQASRTAELVRRGVYSAARLDNAQAEVDQLDASVVAAEASLSEAREALGPAGDNNPQLREALATLERAQLDLLRTTVLAPADGVVTNLQLSVGGFVSAGERAMTFIDVNTIWITAAFKENSLEKIAVGSPAEVLFDVLPGKLFNATVESVGLGVAQGSVDPQTGLPKVATETGWVRTPQSFPVRLTLDDGLPKGVRYGSQANVVVYTGDHPVTNAIGRYWMRFVSYLTYAS